MSFEFEDEYNMPSIQRNYFSNPPKGMAKFLLKIKLAKTEESANKILLVFATLMLILSISVVIWYINDSKYRARAPYHFSNNVLKSLPLSVQNNILQKK